VSRRYEKIYITVPLIEWFYKLMTKIDRVKIIKIILFKDFIKSWLNTIFNFLAKLKNNFWFGYYYFN
jgi:hypothetical protein